MAITINGDGSISGISAGGLPDSSVVTADIADANITAAKLDGAQSGSAPIYGCRAWVNFDGTKDTTGATSTANTNRLIRASGNVTSVLRNGTGDYTITFTTAMPDDDYCAVLTGNQSTAGNSNATTMIYGTADATMLTNSIRVNSGTPSAGTLLDRSVFCVAIFR